MEWHNVYGVSPSSNFSLYSIMSWPFYIRLCIARMGLFFETFLVLFEEIILYCVLYCGPEQMYNPIQLLIDWYSIIYDRLSMPIKFN